MMKQIEQLQKNFRRSRVAVLFTFAMFGLPSSAAVAQAKGEEQRTEFQSAYEEQRKTRGSFLGGEPSYYLTPRRDNIGFALGIEPVDIHVDPVKKDTADTTTKNTLDMTGYTFIPTVAFFGSTFGIGISAEIGARKIEYLHTITATTNDPEYFFEQSSETQYSGAGLYAYILIPKQIMPRFLTGTIIGGGRSLTAMEKSRGVRVDPEKIPAGTDVKYDVNIGDAGLNFALTLARTFQIVPWMNYRVTSFGGVKDKSGADESTIAAETLSAVKLDRRLIWTSNPQMTYGIDLAFQLDNVDIRFGGLLGYVAGLSRSSERIQDRTVSVSLAYYLAPPQKQ